MQRVYTRRLNGPLLWLAIAAAVAVGAALAPSLVDANLIAKLFALAVLAVTLACVFMTTTIVVDDERVKLSVIGFSQSIPLETITSVRVGPETRLLDGAGPRFLGNATGYIVGGPSVQIETSTTSYLASAERPEEVVAEIEARRRNVL